MLRRLSTSLSELLNLQRNRSLSETDDDAGGSESALHRAVGLGDEKKIECLLQQSADVNARDCYDKSPLHLSARLENCASARLLLQGGAEINAQDFEGNTALHVACREASHHVVSLLLYYRAVISIRNHYGRTALDVACEFGRTNVSVTHNYIVYRNVNKHKAQIVELLLDCGVNLQQCVGGSATAAERRSRGGSRRRRRGDAIGPLHLAAANGHADVLALLVGRGADVDQRSAGATALHAAAANGRADAVKFLLLSGADWTVRNGDAQLASDLARRHAFKQPTAAKEVRAVLAEAAGAVYGRALDNYRGLSSDELNFDEGDLLWITERADERRWKGVVLGRKFHQSNSGYFPSSAVQVVNKDSAMNRANGSQRQLKKVNVPQVPTLPTSSANGNNGVHLVTGAEANGNAPAGYPMDAQRALVASPKRLALCHADSLLSPRHRNSTGSTSSQASSGFESMPSASQTTMSSGGAGGQAGGGRRADPLRGDSPPSRDSVHSGSSGSLGSSLERLDESGYSSHLNISELLYSGVPDEEVLCSWLQELRLDDYVALFVGAGYDMATVARMTPEDLTAIGVTKPGHRKRLTAEIHRLQVRDGWPDNLGTFAGGLREWLFAIGLPEYTRLFEAQGFFDLRSLFNLTWEDFDDIGITKLGHLKRLGLALKKLKDGKCASSVPAASAVHWQPTVVTVHQPPPPSPRSTAQVRPFQQPTYSAAAAAAASSSSMSTFNQSPPVGGYECGTFPRRSPMSNFNGASPDSLAQPTTPTPPRRPMVEVKPTRPVAHVLAKRASRELPPPPPPVDESEPRKDSQCAVLSPYANVMVERRCEPSASELTDSFANAGSIKLSLHSPSRLLGRRAPSPPRRAPVPPPAPLGRPAPSLSPEAVSPASSLDEFPPPPSPIQCEQSIRTLRSVVDDSAPPVAAVASSDRCSTSSGETLPFANENCGTIRAREAPVVAAAVATGPARPSVRAAFAPVPLPNNAVAAPRKPSAASLPSAAGGDVLGDIGDMLQNLTHELDAMLYDPNRAVVS